MGMKTRVRGGRQTEYEVVEDSTDIVLSAFDLCEEHGVHVAYGTFPTEEEIGRAKQLKPGINKQELLKQVAVRMLGEGKMAELTAAVIEKTGGDPDKVKALVADLIKRGVTPEQFLEQTAREKSSGENLMDELKSLDHKRLH